MIQLLIVAIFFILNVLFFIRYFWFGIYEFNFLDFQVSYLFERSTAIESFKFALFSFICLTSGLCLPSFILRDSFKNFKRTLDKRSSNLYFLALISVIIQFCYSLYVFFISGGDYNQIAHIRMTSSYIFDIRYIPLLYLSYVCLNNGFSQIVRRKSILFIALIYFISSLMVQSRSDIFDLIFLFIYIILLQDLNKIRFKYILAFYPISLFPNIFILFRSHENVLEGLTNTRIIQTIFNYEYTVLLANLLSSTIELSDFEKSNSITFFNSLVLVIPSPLRNLFNLSSEPSIYYDQQRILAGAGGGGFSLLGELNMNFGSLTHLLIFIFGILISTLILINRQNLGSSSLITATFPIIIANAILLLRNDLFPFFKSTIYILIAAVVLTFYNKIKFSE